MDTETLKAPRYSESAEELFTLRFSLTNSVNGNELTESLTFSEDADIRVFYELVEIYNEHYKANPHRKVFCIKRLRQLVQVLLVDGSQPISLRLAKRWIEEG